MKDYNPEDHGYRFCQYYLNCDAPSKRSVLECPVCGQLWLITPRGEEIKARKLNTYESTLYLKQGHVPR